jgi:ParB family chromosome partitioning protein
MASTAKNKKPPRKATATARPAPLPVVSILVSKIDPSPQNRDAQTDLAPLVASIKAHGLQQAIKVRPKGDRFEIVYGERRWRACSELGYAEIPATVEDVDDNRAAEIRALENLQRKDPHALEEAEEYERLLALKDAKGNTVHTPETVAKIAGRSVGHVYNRLKLTDLAPELRKALYKQELLLTGAFVIARGIPTDLQAEAWQKMQHYAENEAYEEELDDDERLTVRAIQNIIDHDYSSRLESAPFSLKDGKLVAAAGSCDACPKRSGNQPHLFQQSDPKDTCTDLTCFRAKVEAYVAREKQRVLAIGGKVLTDEESRRVFNGGSQLPFNSKWLDLDQQNYEDPKRRNWRALLGDLCPPPVLAFTAQAKPVLLADRAAMLATLKEHGLDPDSLRKKADAKKKKPAAIAAAAGGADRAPHHDDPDDDQDLDEDLDEPEDASSSAAPTTPAEQRFQATITRETRQRIIAAIVAAAEGAGADDNRFVQLVYETTLHGGYHNAILDAVKRRLGTKRPKGEYAPTALMSHGEGLNAQQLRALLLELAIGRSGYYVTASSKLPKDLERAVELYKIDATAIEKTVTEELSAKRAARLCGAKPGGA